MNADGSRNLNLDYERPLGIAEDIWWVGYFDEESALHCNPYLIVDGGEAVLIDSGSRPDFPTVMMKILQTGIAPGAIRALVCQHYDPDLCGGIPNFEDVIDRDDLVIIADKSSQMFIRHYGVASRQASLADLNFEYRFSSGRRLRFFRTPYAHAEGSFVTFDEKTGVLFSSDLFGSYSPRWQLFFHRDDECRSCPGVFSCTRKNCELQDIFAFHRHIIPSGRVLRHAMNIIRDIPCSVIAPQHGSVISEPADIAFIRDTLAVLPGVGVDAIMDENGEAKQ